MLLQSFLGKLSPRERKKERKPLLVFFLWFWCSEMAVYIQLWLKPRALQLCFLGQELGMQVLRWCLNLRRTKFHCSALWCFPEHVNMCVPM